MQIQERGQSWQATVNHKGTRYRRSFKSLTEARAWGLEAEARLLRGDAPDMGERASAASGRPQTARQLLDWTFETRWRSQRSGDKTRDNALEVLDLIGPNLSISKIDAFVVGKVRMALQKKGNANGTINRKLAALSAMLTEAMRMDLIVKKPHIERLEETEKRRFRFTPEIEEKAYALFNRLGVEWMRRFIMASIDTGMRQGEVLNLRASDFNTNAVTVVETKSGRNRVIPLTQRAYRALSGQYAATLQDHLFEGITASSVAQQWHKLRAHLDLLDEPSFVPHILRHEFCSRLADKGVSAPAIMKLAGHSSLTVTQRYVNLSTFSTETAIRLLETD